MWVDFPKDKCYYVEFYKIKFYKNYLLGKLLLQIMYNLYIHVA